MVARHRESQRVFVRGWELEREALESVAKCQKPTARARSEGAS